MHRTFKRSIYRMLPLASLVTSIWALARLLFQASRKGFWASPWFFGWAHWEICLGWTVEGRIGQVTNRLTAMQFDDQKAVINEAYSSRETCKIKFFAVGVESLNTRVRKYLREQKLCRGVENMFMTRREHFSPFFFFSFLVRRCL